MGSKAVRAKFIKCGDAKTAGDLITAYKYLQGNNIIEGKELFGVLEDDTT